MHKKETRKVFFRRLPLTPFSLHAFSLASIGSQVLEIRSVGHPLESICATKHDCITSCREPSSIVLSTSACDLLGVAEKDKVAVAPIDTHLARIVATSFTARSEKGVVISPGLAKVLQVTPSDEIVICPAAYTAQRHNARLKIMGIEGSKPQSEELAIWIDQVLLLELGLKAESGTYVYRVGSSPVTRTEFEVLKHPGFCYLQGSELAPLGLREGEIIEVSAGRSRTGVAQVHLISADMRLLEAAYLDPNIADDLRLAHSDKLRVQALKAHLFWAVKEPVDDLTSKARNAVGLDQKALTGQQYMPHENARLYCRGQRYIASIIASTSSLGEDYAGVTPLRMREAHLKPGHGFFLSREHEKCAVAKVGIFNVEEVGELAVKGSAQLQSIFEMPCLVELYNPKDGMSLDVLMECDTYPRPVPMVRMPRTARQLLAIERGQDILIKELKEPQDQLIQRLRRIRKLPLYHLLVFLIGRRRIHMSVAPAHSWDDQSQVVRLNSEALAILGIVEGDRVRISSRNSNISRVAFARGEDRPTAVNTESTSEPQSRSVPLELQIGVDARGRHALGHGRLDFGTVVEVERDMAFVLRKSLNLTIIPLVGTVVTVVTLFQSRPVKFQVLIAALLMLFFFYLALSVERSKVQ